MRQLATAAAVFATVLAAGLAAPAAQAVPPGQVHFWPEPHQMGSGGAWAYSPPGYREADPRVQRHAYSFDSHAPVSVYAISYQPGGRCLYREIRPDDYDNNWTAWGTKFDGVSDTKMGCEPG
ncbi:hypothetical protein AB0D04_10585 [Streptomyces sp. NPDC048483]|uniref:hypothetical protein n=1 Tax=Streptomyces sp. NPDC048483 TaxID=3154927 RepID=UPI00343EF1A1